VRIGRAIGAKDPSLSNGGTSPSRAGSFRNEEGVSALASSPAA